MITCISFTEGSLTQIREEASEPVADGTDERPDGTDERPDGTDEVPDGNDEVADGNDQDTAEDQS